MRVLNVKLTMCDKAIVYSFIKICWPPKLYDLFYLFCFNMHFFTAKYEFISLQFYK